MLEGLAALAHRRVVLASASPRRLELLRQVGLHHIQVRPSKFEENLDKSRFTAAQYAVETARHKALDVCAAADCEADLVVAADTVRTPLTCAGDWQPAQQWSTCSAPREHTRLACHANCVSPGRRGGRRHPGEAGRRSGRPEDAAAAVKQEPQGAHR
jgi:hypothetical protein